MNLDFKTVVGRLSQGRILGGASLWMMMAAWLPCVSAGLVSRLEYYIDDDPGEGNGIALEIEGEAAEFDLPTSGLAPGLHFLTVRALEEREGEEIWSHHQTVPFTLLPEENPGQIDRLEVVVGEDAGLGQGQPLALDDEGLASVPVEGLELLHRQAKRLPYRALGADWLCRRVMRSGTGGKVVDFSEVP